MPECHFRLVVRVGSAGPTSDEQLLDATDALGAVGCDDCSIGVHDMSLELEFDRRHESLQEAIASAIRDVERAGFVVESLQMDRDAVLAVGSP